jgi:hypothetical protein
MYLNEAVIAANENEMKIQEELIYCDMCSSIKCNSLVNGLSIRVTFIWGGSYLE